MMRRMPWTTCLWPGLSQLWAYGSWTGLSLAILAAGVLNVLLLVSFGWTELIDAGLRNILWGVLGISWIAAAGWSARQCRRQLAARTIDPEEDPFGKALDHYLQGEYHRTEQILEGLLRQNVRDLEARLMLATLLRRTGRFDEATRQLDALVKFEGAGKWELETQQERELLAESKTRKPAAA
jgi:hypothetical protein